MSRFLPPASHCVGQRCDAVAVQASDPRSGERSVARLLACAALVLAVGLGGCSANVETGTDNSAPTDLPAVENPAGPPGYRQLVTDTFGRLGDFWKAKLADQGAEAVVPKRLVSYEGRTDDINCGGQRVVPQNAQYCPVNTSISWDARWLYGDLYRKVGPSAVAFLLAHEYGHFVQDKLKIQNKFKLTIEAELNADCLAGAWFGKVNQDVARLTRADFEALYIGVLNVADPRGLPWQNPQAHGRAVERRRALGTGLRRGLEGCLKAYKPGFS